MRQFNRGLDWESVKAFLNPPTTGPLFPNLRILRCIYTENTLPLLRLPLPSLHYLFASFKNPYLLLDSLESFPEIYPNIRRVSFHVVQPDVAFSKLISNCICRWRNLQWVACREITLDADALIHLSHTDITQLFFTLSTTLPVSDSSLVFSNLHNLTVQSESLESISRLLYQARLPAIMDFGAFIHNCPVRSDLTSFLAGVPTSNASHTLETLQLKHSDHLFGIGLRSEARPLMFEDLQPCMVFRNLRNVELDIAWNVGLTDFQVLTLASAWPKLEDLKINEQWGWGWNSRAGGITPGGLIQLLETCRSLRRICLRLDTQGYIAVPTGQVPASIGLMLPNLYSINALDSPIEAESVIAMATFFCGIAACSQADFTFFCWGEIPMTDFPNWQEYEKRWDHVYDRFTEALGRCNDE